MSKTLHISASSINKLRGDSEFSRTVAIEVEETNFDVTSAIRLKAKFKCVLVESDQHGPIIELRYNDGSILGYVPLEG